MTFGVDARVYVMSRNICSLWCC